MNPDPEPAARCPAMYRVLPGGWSQCRRTAHADGRHHGAGITWSTGALTPVLRYETCADPGCCTWPPRSIPYFGASVARTKPKPAKR